MAEQQPSGCGGCILLVAVCVIGGVAFAAMGGSGGSGCEAGFQRAAANIETGSRIHYGQGAARTEFGEVVATQSRHLFPDGEITRAIQVRTPSGELRWMKRQAIIDDHNWVVPCTSE